jgi:hypothetical protein
VQKQIIFKIKKIKEIKTVKISKRKYKPASFDPDTAVTEVTEKKKNDSDQFSKYTFVCNISARDQFVDISNGYLFSFAAENNIKAHG